MNSNEEGIQLLHLLSGSCDVLPPYCFKLRSYLNIHISNLADQQNLQLLKSFRNRNKTCPYCYSSWSAATTSFKLLPSKRYKTKSKTNDNEKGKTLNESRNTLVLKCKVCSKKSSFSLVKRKPIEEKVKQENVESVKKKKKKRDKSCGLAVNLLKNYEAQEIVIIKKKKDRKDAEKNSAANLAHPQNIVSKGPAKSAPISKSLVSGTSKNLVPNPFANQIQQKFPGKKHDKKLERLKEAVKKEKTAAKTTLKDFLSLI